MTGDRCGAIYLGHGGARWVCARSPAAMYRRCCQHEHPREVLLCAFHAGTPSDGLCRECLNHPTDPHECGIHVQPLADKRAL